MTALATSEGLAGRGEAVVAVAGASGYVGSLVAEALAKAGAAVRPLPRAVLDGGSFVIAGELDGVNAVVNAAGRAAPSSRRTDDLFRANAELPRQIAEACIVAGVRRFVHVSSAAVQGSRNPLDESMTVAARSPYAKSKAAGEQALAAIESGSCEIVIYRATSVQGEGQRSTALLRRYARLPLLPMVNRGDAPVPVSLDRVTAEAIAHLALVRPYPGRVVLHPSEGQTIASLLASFGWNGRSLPLPSPLVRVALRAMLAASSPVPALYSKLRLAELILLGQRQEASRLAATGFKSSFPRAEAFAALGAKVE